MAITKPTKPTDLMPTHFADSGVKNNFSSSKIENGFSANFDDILQGDNLNYMLDSIGKQLNYLNTVVDHINSIGVNKVLGVNSNNQLDSTDINGLLPSQTGNEGKYLTTNGSQVSWSNDFRIIGDPIFTLNFNQTLPENCIWLEGAVKPITGEWAQLFSIYGWQYDTSYINTQQFRLPNFLNKSIWGGTNAGYIEEGLPNPNLSTVSAGVHTHTRGSMNIQGQIGFSGIDPNTSWAYASGAFTKNNLSGAGNSHDNPVNGAYVDFYFNASRNWTGATSSNGEHTHTINISNSLYGKTQKVLTDAIKVRVYTRYK